jgi:GNAT superfamily N-acetyltransferase
MNLRIDTARHDVAAIHRFLSEDSYWARGIPRDTVERALANSLCFSAWVGADYAGFARVVSDRATFAWLCDVFVLPEFRGRGIARALLAVIDADPGLQGLRRWMLATADAHALYAGVGYAVATQPERLMVRHDPEIYLRRSNA